jgi:hypothetical protein
MKMLSLLSFDRWAALSLLVTGLPPVAVSAVDVKTYVVDKGIQYFQTSTAAPTPDDKNGASFEASVKSSGSNLVASASIQLPTGGVAPLLQDGSDEFKLKKKYNKQSSLDANFPNGSYTFALTTAHDSAKTLNLSLVGDLYPAQAPRLNDFPATQAIDAGSYFRFTWDAWSAGGPNDFVQLHIEDSQGEKVWETPDFGESGALDGRATSVLIPPRTLAAGQSYQANLEFAKASQRDASSYPGAIGAAFYYKRTKFMIQTAASASYADVKLYWVTKSRRYQQTGATAPTPQPSKTFSIELLAQATAAGSVTKASVQLPNSRMEELTLEPDDKTFDFADEAPTQAQLDTTFPNGTFTFQITGSSGTKTPPLSLSGDAYPSAPHVLTVPNVVDPAADWVVSWEPFDGGTSADFIQLHIEDEQGDKVFETPDFGKSGALTGTALGALVPRMSFAAGQTYSARVVFQRNLVSDSTSYPGALGLAAYASRTTFEVSTGGETGPMPPRLTPLLPFSSTGAFRFLLQGTPGSVVRVDASDDVRQWTSISTSTLPASGQVTVTDTRASTAGGRCYRAVASP